MTVLLDAFLFGVGFAACLVLVLGPRLLSPRKKRLMQQIIESPDGQPGSMMLFTVVTCRRCHAAMTHKLPVHVLNECSRNFITPRADCQQAALAEGWRELELGVLLSSWYCPDCVQDAEIFLGANL